MCMMLFLLCMCFIKCCVFDVFLEQLHSCFKICCYMHVKLWAFFPLVHFVCMGHLNFILAGRYVTTKSKVVHEHVWCTMCYTEGHPRN
jgi:hypothetical protein